MDQGFKDARILLQSLCVRVRVRVRGDSREFCRLDAELGKNMCFWKSDSLLPKRSGTD